jgi:hypothetical protein
MNFIKEIREEFRSAYMPPSKRDLNILALLFLVAPGAIGGYLIVWKENQTGWIWLAVGVLVCSLRLLPAVFVQVYRLWIALAIIMGYFVSRIILTAIFCLIITPMALVMRILGKDPMDRAWDRSETSYWKLKHQEEDKSLQRYGKQF